MTETNLELRIDTLSCERGGRLVLQDLSFQCQSGDVLVVRGPNGVGKSTLLRVLAGLVDKSGGSINLKGIPLEADEPWLDQLHYIGHLDAVKPAFTVRENVQFWSDYYGGGATSVEAALTAFDLLSLADLPSQFLSAGQKKRTALARIVAAPRPIWLLDEPSVSLDRNAKDLLVKAIERHAAQGGIVLMTSHEDLELRQASIMTLESPSMVLVDEEGSP